MDYLSTFLIFAGLSAIYYYLTRNYNYWSSRGVRGPKPWPLLGSLGDMLFKTLPDIEEERLKKFGPIYGLYEGTTPMLSVAEPELVRNILVRDFHLFVNRRIIQFGDPFLDRALSIASDDEWKAVRAIITPAFSNTKMKKMYKLVEECLHAMDKKLEEMIKKDNEIEMKKLMGDYTMDALARSCFATKIDTHNDHDNPFMKNALIAFSGIRIILVAVLGPVAKLLNISVIDPKIMDFFKNAIEAIIKQRESDDSASARHHDFLQIMINSKNRIDINEDKAKEGSNYGSEDSKKSVDNRSTTVLTNDDVMANSFIFLLGGYETHSILLSHLVYSLATHPECQQRLLEEICSAVDPNGAIDYETLVRLPYLDACVSETLRLYNPALMTTRTASEDYKLGETGITITKGMVVCIPIHAIHHSPQYYLNPKRFDPDRFMPENRNKLIAYTYLPFGAGPRNCVGIRFALMEAKTAIAGLITKYKFFATKNTKIPLKVKMFCFQMLCTDIIVGVELRNK